MFINLQYSKLRAYALKLSISPLSNKAFFIIVSSSKVFKISMFLFSKLFKKISCGFKIFKITSPSKWHKIIIA